MPVAARVKVWIEDVFALLPPDRTNDECWLHPSPKPGWVNRGITSRSFAVRVFQRAHSHTLCFGVVALQLQNKPSGWQRQGYIEQGCHLSHLCGNWTCCNPGHLTVEPGRLNLSRNRCFPHVRSPCDHTPICLKDKKRRLYELERAAGPSVDEGYGSQNSVGTARLSSSQGSTDSRL